MLPTRLRSLGYPDHGTRQFISVLSNACTSAPPVFIITDADVHGIRIAQTYESSLRHLCVHWLGVRPSHNGTYFRIKPQALLPLSDSDRALLRSNIHRVGQPSVRMTPNERVFITEMNTLLLSNRKFEMEALSSVSSDSPVSGLLAYILRRLNENSVRLDPGSTTQHPDNTIR